LFRHTLNWFSLIDGFLVFCQENDGDLFKIDEGLQKVKGLLQLRTSSVEGEVFINKVIKLE